MPQPGPDPTTVTPEVLRGWQLPEPSGDKNSRGSILVIGGSSETLCAVLLAAEAAMRAGAGKLQVATVASLAPHAAAALPEALVRSLPETSRMPGLPRMVPASGSNSSMVASGVANSKPLVTPAAAGGGAAGWTSGATKTLAGAE